MSKVRIKYTVSWDGLADRIKYREAKRGDKITRHTGSLIDIRNFTPLFIRVEDGPSSSTTREVLALEIKRAKLRGATKESVWGSPKPLDSVPQLKEWMHELRNPDGNQYAHPALCFVLVGLKVHHQRYTQNQEEAARRHKGRQTARRTL